MRPGNIGYSGQKSVGISCDGIQQKKGGLNRVITTVIALAASGVQAEYRGPDGSDQWQPRGPGNEAVQIRVDTSCLPNFVIVSRRNGAMAIATSLAIIQGPAKKIRKCLI